MAFCARFVVFSVLVGCAYRHHGFADAGADAIPDACEGLQCFQFDCAPKGLPPTSVSGTVYAPNGTLPLYGVNVYVPASAPGPLHAGVQCDRCNDGLLGGALAQTTTDEAGHFQLTNVPATSDVPIVIQVGKWRRELRLPTVAACQDLPIGVADTTLPKSTTDLTPATTGVDLPHIAISTGNADALECLIRKIGIADAEISTDGQPGKVHLFADPAAIQGAAMGQGANQFKAGFAGGTGAFANSMTLWTDVNKMLGYDILIFSCEGGQYPASKPQAAMDAVKQYADLGGRVFLSHWHNVWIEGAGASGAVQVPPVWIGVASWNNSGTTFQTPPPTPPATCPANTTCTTAPELIDEVSNPKGASFATWMLNVMGSTTRDSIPIFEGKQTVSAIPDPTRAERWVYWDTGAIQYPQNFQFTTPNEIAPEQRCGKVVFSDMHVASGSSSDPGLATAYPSGCSTAPLTAQEKALAFMFFDIASCVQNIP